jgi:hypothetical protein
LVSIRLKSTALGAVVLPSQIEVLPTTSQNYEVLLVKNPVLTGASWVTHPTDPNVEYDISATATAAGAIVQHGFTTASGSGGSRSLTASTGYNWALQPGVSLAGVSDILTIQIRTVSGATTGDAVAALSFWDLLTTA